jgi:hypothetical protein
MTVAPLVVKTVYPDSDGNPMSDNTVQFGWEEYYLYDPDDNDLDFFYNMTQPN